MKIQPQRWGKRPASTGGLTPRQRALLSYLEAHQDEKGYLPSVREAGRGLGLASTNAVAELLAQLVSRGCVSRPRPGALVLCHRVGRERALELACHQALVLLGAGKASEAGQALKAALAPRPRAREE